MYIKTRGPTECAKMNDENKGKVVAHNRWQRRQPSTKLLAGFPHRTQWEFVIGTGQLMNTLQWLRLRGWLGSTTTCTSKRFWQAVIAPNRCGSPTNFCRTPRSSASNNSRRVHIPNTSSIYTAMKNWIVMSAVMLHIARGTKKQTPLPKMEAFGFWRQTCSGAQNR